MRFLDAQADLIRKWFSPANATRLGVVMVDLGILLTVLWPVIARSEPPTVYVMSSLALIFGGITVIIEAMKAEADEE